MRQIFFAQLSVVVIELLRLREALFPACEVHEAAGLTPVDVEIVPTSRKHALEAWRCTHVTGRHDLRLSDELRAGKG